MLNGLFLYGRVFEWKKTIRVLDCFSHFYTRLLNGYFLLYSGIMTQPSDLLPLTSIYMSDLMFKTVLFIFMFLKFCTILLDDQKKLVKLI